MIERRGNEIKVLPLPPALRPTGVGPGDDGYYVNLDPTMKSVGLSDAPWSSEAAEGQRRGKGMGIGMGG